MKENDWRLAAALFVIVSSVYYATVAGITSSNDGSHYALVRALVDKRSFEISEYLSFTENQDYALNGDLRFSDRPPGTAVLAAPVDAVSVFLPRPLVPVPSKHDAGNPRLAYTLMLPVIAASLTVIILFWILRAHVGLSQTVSLLTVVAFAFGTINWKYGSLLYQHATTALAVILAVALMLHWSGKIINAGQQLLLGSVLGAGVLLEYTNIVFIALAGLYWLVVNLLAKPRRLNALFIIVGGLIPGALLMAYNSVNFGGPLELSTFNVDTTIWPQNTSFFHDFATPLWVGLPTMLFYGSDNQGLFWLAPVSLLGLLGLLPLWRRSRNDFAMCAGLFTAMLLLFSTSTTFNPYTNDGRYITPFLGLWFVVVGFGIDWLEARLQPAGRYAIVFGLLFVSIYFQIMHIAYSWGHDLKPDTFRPWAAAPENLAALFGAVFPNLLNLPLWWGVLAIAGLILLLWRQRLQANAAPLAPEGEHGNP